MGQILQRLRYRVFAVLLVFTHLKSSDTGGPKARPRRLTVSRIDKVPYATPPYLLTPFVISTIPIYASKKFEETTAKVCSFVLKLRIPFSLALL